MYVGCRCFSSVAEGYMISRLRSILYFYFTIFEFPLLRANGDRGGGGVAPFASCCGI